MPNPFLDATFQPVLVVGMLAVVLVVLPFRIKSWASREALDRRQEGVFMLATLRPMGLTHWLGTIAFMINPARMAWSAVPLPAWLRWSGAVLGAVAVLLLIWTLRALGTNLTDTVVTRKVHAMVTHGPYRLVRHPFYDCMALLVSATSLIAANWFLFATGLGLILLIGVRVRTEEEKLVARFGDEYRAYMRRVGRFLPGHRAGNAPSGQTTTGLLVAPRIAIVALLLSCLAIAGAYASAFFPGGAPAAAPWGVAVGSAGTIASIMALGATRRGRLHRLAFSATLATFTLVAGAFAFALLQPAAEGAGGALLLGLPLRTAVIIYGIGLLPLLVLPLAYAATFDAQILSEDDLRMVREGAASHTIES